MELYLENKFNIDKIKTVSNILLIYGNNNSGKTYFTNYIYTMTKINKLLIVDKDFINYNEVILINEDYNLKKELELQKTSIIRKNLLNNLHSNLEENNLDFYEKINNLDETKFIKDHINKNINLTNQKYRIYSKLSTNNDFDLIDKLFKLQLIDDKGNEVSENHLSRTEKFNIFIDLFTSNNPKNKIFIFDSPDVGLDNYELIKFSNLIKKLSKNNLIFITYNNPLLFLYLELFTDNFLYLANKEIKCIFFSKDILLESYLLSLKNNSIENINKLKDEYLDLIETDDILKMKKNLYIKYFLKYINKLNFLDFENNHFNNMLLKENEKFIWKNILKDNDFLLKK